MPTAPKVLRHRRTKRAPERRKNSHQRGYTHRWEKASAAWLQEHFAMGHVYCAGCGGLLDGNRKDIHVDHKVDHKGDMEAFWDQSLWQAMHAACHSRKTMRENAR
jgi:5-methylcytosine-specific restriction protein A